MNRGRVGTHKESGKPEHKDLGYLVDHQRSKGPSRNTRARGSAGYSTSTGRDIPIERRSVERDEGAPGRGFAQLGVEVVPGLQ